MAPRVKKSAKGVPPGRGAPPKETVARGGGSPRTAPGRKRIDRHRAKGKKTKQKLKLKGWLATPADWARFDAWAKINAQPKKVPEPEPITRPAKPLSQLKKKMTILAEPRKAPDLSINCRLDHSISKAALKAAPSKRTMLLALPNIKLCDFGRVYYKVSPAALQYQPSSRIIELSQPRIFIPEECKPLRTSRCLDEERLRKLALAKKLLYCPQQLTEEEIEEIFTPYGIKRTALTYEITPWMEFLALPPYKTIKERKDKDAVTWKKKIIHEGEERGKSALAEHRKREEEKERKRRCEEEKKRMARKRKCDEAKKKKAKGGGVSKRSAEEDDEEEEEEEEEGEEEEPEVDEQKAKRRKIEKHAWRFAPVSCKDDAFSIKRAALKGKASSRMEELSKPRIHKSKAIRANAFVVKKAALSATASGRVADLAKPPKPRSPVEKRPPREKDKYGRPIFEMPAYGKVLPKTKPYKMGKCPSSEEKKKEVVVKKRPIDPIVYEATYDPCIYPDMAKRQKMERKRVEKLLKKTKRKKKKNKEKGTRSEKKSRKTGQSKEAEEKDVGKTADETVGAGTEEQGEEEE